MILPSARDGGRHRDDTDAPRRLELGREHLDWLVALGYLVSSQRRWTSGASQALSPGREEVRY
jgi:hypothetical protein